MPPKKKAKIEGAEWQWLDDDNEWQSFATEDSKSIEVAYATTTTCFVTSDLTFNKGYSTKYTFDFGNMEQINGDSKKKRKMRRLAPPSEYTWEWKDDAGLFVPFYEEDNVTVEQLCLQAGSTKSVKTTKLSWNKGYDDNYVFTFGVGGADKDDNGKPMTKGEQKNESSGTTREIRRIQKKNAWDAKGFGIAAVSADKLKTAVAEATKTTEKAAEEEEDASPRAGGGVKKAEAKKEADDTPSKAAATTTSTTTGGGGGSVGPSIESSFNTTNMSVPFYWSAGTAKVGAKTLIAVDEVDVSLKSAEATAVKAFVEGDFSSSGKKCKITKITRIENATLYTFYALRRMHIAKRNEGNPNELRLCYGDHNKTNMNTICKLGFDTRVAQPGGIYGRGLYFGTNPSQFDNKCHKTGSERQMFVCRAAVGSFCQGTNDIRRPLPKDPKKPSGDIHDCCANDKKKPTQYVFFENTQMYPEYVVSYTC